MYDSTCCRAARLAFAALQQRTEWPVIAAERTPLPRLYAGYIVVLAAIPPIVGFLSTSLIWRIGPVSRLLTELGSARASAPRC